MNWLINFCKNWCVCVFVILFWVLKGFFVKWKNIFGNGKIFMLIVVSILCNCVCDSVVLMVFGEVFVMFVGLLFYMFWLYGCEF